jgi:hypothetical protein
MCSTHLSRESRGTTSDAPSRARIEGKSESFTLWVPSDLRAAAAALAAAHQPPITEGEWWRRAGAAAALRAEAERLRRGRATDA